MRSPAACTAPTGSAATRCPTCWSSAAGPGCGAAAYVDALGGERPAVDEADVDAPRRRRRLRAASSAERRREPVHAAPGAPADDERPGRHHPPRGRDGARRSSSSTSSRSAPSSVGVEGAPAVQPGLAPRARPAQHAAGQRVRRPGGAGAHREPRRPHPRGLPGDGPEWRAGQPDLPARRRRPVDGASDRAGAGRSRARAAELIRPTTCSNYFDERRAGQVPRRRGRSYGGATDELRRAVPGLAGRRRRRRAGGLRRRGQRGRGRPRHHPPAAGHPGARPRGALELQGRQVRLVQRRRSTAARGCCA